MGYRSSNNLHVLLSSGRQYKIPKNQTVQSSDERFRPLLNLVKSGYIKRYEIGNDGSISVQAIYGPEDVFPLTLVFRSLLDQEVYEGPEVIYYEAMTDAEIYSVDTYILKEAAEENPIIYKDLLVEAGVRTHSNIQRLENLSLKNSYRRTAHQLAYFAHRFGEPKNSGTKISVSLTHQDLADILSLTRETVSINMQKLQNKNLIKSGHHIYVPDIAKLEKEAFK